MHPPHSTSGSALSSLTSPAEYMDLQVDYWVTSPPKADRWVCLVLHMSALLLVQKPIFLSV